MRRYSGETLAPNPRIAVVANDAIGNFVVGTPLLHMLRERWNPHALDYYGGTRTWELIEGHPFIDFGCPLHGARPQQIAEVIVDRTTDGQYDLVINMEWTCWAKAATAMLAGVETFVCGPCLGRGGRGDLPFGEDERGDLWRDQEWIREDLCNDYPFLESSHISEVFCRLAYLEGPVPGYALRVVNPPMATPEVLIATAASLPEKLWTLEHWRTALRWFKQEGIEVGLIGAPPAAQREYWQGESLEDVLIADGLTHDLRGKLTLPEVVGALSRARLTLTIDNGVLHLSVGAGTPTVGLFRNGIHRLWAPRSEKLSVLTPGPNGDVSEISPDEVLTTVRNWLK